jgi:toxin ParE1/3/4
MMPAFRLKAKARDDLMAIAAFTQERWKKDLLNKDLKQLDDSFHQLVENPNLGIACDYITSGYRKLPIISHIIYYRLFSDKCVEIIRVPDRHMDVSSKLFKA